MPRPENPPAYRASPIFSFLFAPIKLLYTIFAGSLSLFGYLFPFLPRLISNLSPATSPARSRLNTTGRRPLNPRDTAARFAREFEEGYGSHSLHFFEDGYAQAYDIAKKELKFLLVVLISPEHDDNLSFVKKTLLSEELVNFINDPENNIILWAGNVQDSEAYQVSTALNCSKFPFIALIAHTPHDKSSPMSTIARISGLLPPSAYVPRIRTAISQQSAALDRIRAARAEQNATRSLRDEQNSAYERSLAQDRERARQRREAEAERLRADEEARARLENAERNDQKRELWRLWRAQNLPPEPDSTERKITRVSIRMATGERVVRRFSEASAIEELYAFVECYHLLKSEKPSSSPAPEPTDYKHEYQFQLVSSMPRTIYGLHPGGAIGDKIGRSANLIVEPLVDQDEGSDAELVQS